MAENAAMSVNELWSRRVNLSPDALFLRTPEGDHTYAEFDLVLNRWANGLASAGVSVGDRVALLLGSGTDLLHLELAIQKLGAVMVPLIAGSSAREVAHVLADCAPSHVILDVDGSDLYLPVVEGACSSETRVLVIGDKSDPTRGGTYPDDSSATAVPRVGHLDPMSIMYTSGSTGKPKGVLQPQGGFAEIGRAVSDRLGISADDTYLCVLPLFHTGATHVQLAPAIYAGASFALDPAFSRTRFWERVRAYRATTTVLVPAQISMLMTNPPNEDERSTSLRLAVSQNRPAAFIERFGVEICPIWSMTETSGMGALRAPGSQDTDSKLIGPAMPTSGEFKVTGIAGDSMPPGETGELLFRQKYVMSGYFRDSANTADSLRDGWVHTGDLASLDEVGNLYYHGRLKNVIKRGGENIAGEELEMVIMEHPAVEQCLVTGVPDPIYTEEVYAAVVVREGMAITEAEVGEWCAGHLSKWKIPRYVHLQTDALPALQNGKLDRPSALGRIDMAGAWDRSRQGEGVLDSSEGGQT